MNMPEGVPQAYGVSQIPDHDSLEEPIRSRQPVGDIDPNDPSTWGRVQRNAPCPCGSGSKYKHCHGQLEE